MSILLMGAMHLSSQPSHIIDYKKWNGIYTFKITNVMNILFRDVEVLKIQIYVCIYNVY